MRKMIVLTCLVALAGCRPPPSKQTINQAVHNQLLGTFNWEALNETPTVIKPKTEILPDGSKALIAFSDKPLRSYKLVDSCRITGKSLVLVQNDHSGVGQGPENTSEERSNEGNLKIELYLGQDFSLLDIKKPNSDISSYLANFTTRVSETRIVIEDGLNSLTLDHKSNKRWGGLLKLSGIMSGGSSFMITDPIECVVSR